MEEHMLNKNILKVCEELYVFCCQNNQIKFENFTIDFYINYISGTKNMYIIIFLSNKLSLLNHKSNFIYRKLLCEIILLLTICNKPNINTYSYHEVNINMNIDNLILSIKEKNKNSMRYILNNLLKCKDEFEFKFNLNLTEKQKKDYIWKLWEIILDNFNNKYIDSLFYLYCLNYTNKERKHRLRLLFDAYDSLCEDMIISSDEYNEIIIQCMLKIDLLFQMNKKEEMYDMCMNLLTIDENKEKNTSLFIDDVKKIKLNDNKKIYFYKSNED
jgi:hypothetical protein